MYFLNISSSTPKSTFDSINTTQSSDIMNYNLCIEYESGTTDNDTTVLEYVVLIYNL